MKILVTGATSFVGTHLINSLLDSGHKLFYLVRDKKGFDNEFIWDFKSPLPAGMPECNIIIHLAAYVDFSLKLDIEQYNINTVSTMKLAAYAKSCNAYFILASMAGVHGNKYPEIDGKTPLSPENSYAVSKYLAEEVVKTFIDTYSILRIGGIYGVNGPTHLGLNKALYNAIYKKEPPILFGSGSAKRNYICVLDVVSWIKDLIEKHAVKKNIQDGNSGETLYIASPEILSIQQYLQTITDVVLPGKEIVRREGKEAADMIIRPSATPVSLRTFREYLLSVI